jgi:hypothetical protein
MYKDQDYYPAFITTKLITLLYLRVGIFFYSRVDDRNNSPKGVVLTPKTRSNSNPPLFIEVSVPSHESEHKPEMSMIRSCPDRLEFKNECYSTVNQSISKKQRYLH